MVVVDLHSAHQASQPESTSVAKTAAIRGIPLGNSGYLLPNNPTNQERYEWLAQSIRKYAGEASVVSVQFKAALDELGKGAPAHQTAY
jgi:hypothetical protein